MRNNKVYSLRHLVVLSVIVKDTILGNGSKINMFLNCLDDRQLTVKAGLLQ